MASKEVEVLDPAATVEKIKELASGIALNRRHFIAALGVAGAAAGTELVSGPAAHAQEPKPSGYNQNDILNLLLNIKYLTVTLYSYLTRGTDVPPSSGVANGTGGVYNAPAKLAFTGTYASQLTDMFNELYYDELNQLIALRNLLGTSAASRTTLNMLGTGTTTTASATFTQNQALQYARILEDLSVQAFTGAAAYLTGTNLALAMQIMATDGFHAGAVRLACIQNAVPYLSTDFMTSTSTSGGQSLNTFSGALLTTSPTVFTLPSTNPPVAGTVVTGSGIPVGTVITSVNVAPVYAGSLTGTATVPTNTVTFTSPSSIPLLVVGDTVTGTGIPANAVVSSLSGNTATLTFPTAVPSGSVTLANGITSTASGVALAVGFGAFATKSTTVLTGVTTTSGLQVGMPLSGTNINAGAVIAAAPNSAGPNTITMSLTASGSSTVAPTGFLTSGSTQVALISSVAGISVGQPVTGTGVPTNTTVASIDPAGTFINLSAAATASTGYTFTGTFASGSTAVTALSSTAGLAVGYYVTGPGIATGTTITAISGSTITLSIPTTAAAPTGNTLVANPATTGTAAPTGYLNSGSPTITGVSSLTGVAAGATITGTGIPSGTLVSSSNAATLAVGLSNNAVSTTALTVVSTPFGVLTSGSATILAAFPLQGIAAGQLITGPGIPTGTIVTGTSTSAYTITISQNATVSTAQVVVASPTGTVVATSPYITALSSTTGIAVGQEITGNFIPLGTIVTGINGSNTSTFVGVFASGATSITSVTNTVGFAVGQGISGTGIPSTAVITAIGTGTLTIEPVTTAASPASGASLTTTFVPGSTVAILGTLVSGSNVVTNVQSIAGATPGTSGLSVGQVITGTGIPAASATVPPTTITAITATTLTLSASATAASAVGGNTLTPQATQSVANSVVMSANATGSLAVETINFSSGAQTVVTVPTGNVTSGSPYITALSSMTGLVPGLVVAGGSIPAGTTAVAINAAITTTFLGSYTSGSASITGVGSTAGLAVGQLINGTGIVPGTTIKTVGTNTLTLSANTTTASPAGGLPLTVTFGVSFTGNFASGATSVTGVSSTTGLATGQGLSGTGIAAGTTITAISGTTLTISTATTAASAAGGTTLTATNITPNSVTLSANATATAAAEPITFITTQPLVIYTAGTKVTATTVTPVTTTTLTIPTLQTISFSPGSVTLSNAPTVAGLQTFSFLTADPLDVAPFDPGTAALSAAGPSQIAGSSPAVYQGFFDTAGSATSSGSTPAGFAFARTFSQVLQVLYGSQTTSTYQGGFYPNGVGSSINVV